MRSKRIDRRRIGRKVFARVADRLRNYQEFAGEFVPSAMDPWHMVGEDTEVIVLVIRRPRNDAPSVQRTHSGHNSIALFTVISFPSFP